MPTRQPATEKPQVTSPTKLCRSFLATAAAVLLFTGCGAVPEPTPTPAHPSDPGPSAVVPPPPDNVGPDNPHNKFLLRARSQDGLHWERIPGVLAQQASSPQLCVLDDALTVFFVDRGNALYSVAFDGDGVDPRPLEVTGEGEGLLVDPHVVPLADGRYRLYYIHQPFMHDPGAMPSNRVSSAIGRDGLHWVREPGVRWEGPYVDPDIVPLPEGGWRLFVTKGAQEVHSAHSSDGLQFHADAGQRLAGGGVTSTIPPTGATDQAWRMFFHQRHRIYLATSVDGMHFTPQPEPVLEPDPAGEDQNGVESPSVAWHAGSWWMVYASTHSWRTNPGQGPSQGEHQTPS